MKPVVVALGLLIGVTGHGGPAAARESLWVPVVRAAMGASFHFHPDDDGVVGYALDAGAGVTLMPERVSLLGPELGLVVNAEAGYTLDTLGINLHAFHATAGIGFGNFIIGVLYQPRLIAGASGDSTAIGMRNGVRGYLFVDMLSLELAHQLVRHHDALHHDVHLLLGLNPIGFIALD